MNLLDRRRFIMVVVVIKYGGRWPVGWYQGDVPMRRCVCGSFSLEG